MKTDETRRGISEPQELGETVRDTKQEQNETEIKSRHSPESGKVQDSDKNEEPDRNPAETGDTEGKDSCRKLSEQLSALQSVINLLDWELQSGGTVWKNSDTGTMLSRRLKSLRRDLVLAEKTEKILEKAKSRAEREEDRVGAALVRELAKTRKMEQRLSDAQYERQAEVCEEAGKAWEQAKEESASGQKGVSEKTYLSCLSEQASILSEAAGERGYESFLKDYEPDFSEAEVERFFNTCKTELPLILERGKQISGEAFRPQELYDAQRQEKLVRFLSEYLGFDFKRGVTGQSAHPFTTAVSSDYVCFSDRYVPDNPFAAIFTALHETGHALYEQNVAEELKGTVLAGGCSSAMHEAVARFYENCIGRMEEFWEPIYDKVVRILGGEFERLPFPEFMKAIRAVRPGCLRTEADEVSYPFHILMRYELEKRLFAGTLPADELEEEWNRLGREYLGVVPETAASGYLQDIHWACGQFGYFPAYQLGNAIAAQVYRQVRKVLPLRDLLREGKLSRLNAYLTTYIFRFGLTKTSDEILLDMTGETLNTRYYLDYLRERYEGPAAGYAEA